MGPTDASNCRSFAPLRMTKLKPEAHAPFGHFNSKLPRMLRSPALHHNLLLGIELNRVATLSMHDAEEAVLPPAEREVSHRSGDSDVDANVPRRSLIAKAP